MLIFVHDFETTGIPIYSEPSEGDNQPHIVEVACLLIETKTREVIDSFHCIVKPDGWVIPDEVAAIHVITTERALAEGIPEREAIAAFIAMHDRCYLRVAHNEPFDARIARIAMKRFAADTQDERDEIAEAYKSHERYCTMRNSTKACNLPPTPSMLAKNMKFNNNPTLAEAYKHYTGKELEGAHGAMADAQACAEVYFAIRGVQ